MSVAQSNYISICFMYLQKTNKSLSTHCRLYMNSQVLLLRLLVSLCSGGGSIQTLYFSKSTPTTL